MNKTGVYPMLRTIREKVDEKCPKPLDMTKYVLKSSLKPEKKCPDMRNYVLKTNILPEKKCPDCVCPKVNVTAGLCKKCEPCPACPPPRRCPRPRCPEPQPCPEVKFPKHKPCPQLKCPRPQPCKPKKNTEKKTCETSEKEQEKDTCKNPKCTGCPYCQENSDGLVHHPNYPGSDDFEARRQNNGNVTMVPSSYRTTQGVATTPVPYSPQYQVSIMDRLRTGGYTANESCEDICGLCINRGYSNCNNFSGCDCTEYMSAQ